MTCAHRRRRRRAARARDAASRSRMLAGSAWCPRPQGAGLPVVLLPGAARRLPVGRDERRRRAAGAAAAPRRAAAAPDRAQLAGPDGGRVCPLRHRRPCGRRRLVIVVCFPSTQCYSLAASHVHGLVAQAVAALSLHCGCRCSADWPPRGDTAVKATPPPSQQPCRAVTTAGVA
eukprot:scaffold523_cov446-Prasinococcus_capsulatus_cf.AAC.3